ncbi:MAG: hypothetical protein E2581_08965 [Pseudomonas sp.]|uniref:hypothetical protein n=1 Tax=Pseudomonas sp. TaxID=306 RepID=UPI001DF09588|nr:hypothetical protein [Pseudomonas sp.]MPS98617.1 hypothetical protein [Pseudomonas sp.]
MKRMLLAMIGVHEGLSAQQRQDLVGAGIHTAPGASAGGAFKLSGLPLSEWLVIASIAFVVLQALYLIWKWRRDYKRQAQREEDRALLHGKDRYQHSHQPDTDLGAL